MTKALSVHTAVMLGGLLQHAFMGMFLHLYLRWAWFRACASGHLGRYVLVVMLLLGGIAAGLAGVLVQRSWRVIVASVGVSVSASVVYGIMWDRIILFAKTRQLNFRAANALHAQTVEEVQWTKGQCAKMRTCVFVQWSTLTLTDH